MKLFFLTLIIAIILSGCDNNSEGCDSTGIMKSESCCSSYGPVQIYKTEKDYSKNVFIQLSEDKKVVTAYPGASDIRMQAPEELAEGYLLKKMVGNAVLSMTIDEYEEKGDSLSISDLLELVIDENPFTEFYECCRLCIDTFDKDKLNTLIIENKLCNCENEGWWIFN